MTDFRLLQAFVALAEELHFGRAAKRLGISQPPLTRRIAQLERDVGVALFDRDRRGTRLSVAGAAFLPEARRLCVEATEAGEVARRAARGATGILRLGFAPSAAWLIAKAVGEHRRLQPDVLFRLEEEATTRQLASLRANRLDLALVRGPITDDTQGLRCEVILRERLVAVLPSDHRLGARRTISVRDVRMEPLLLFPREVAPGFHDAVLRLCRAVGYDAPVRQEATEFQSLVSLVAAGFGFTLVPASFRAWQHTGVVYVPIRETQPIAELSAAYRARATPLAEQFLGQLRSAAHRGAADT